MQNPLIDRLTTDLGWPRLAGAEELEAFVSAPGLHVVFLPGDPARNLETSDVAVILPELRLAFQGRFDCAVVTDETLAQRVGADAGVFKTPNLAFYRDGAAIGSIPKVRDWADYMARIGNILSTPRSAA